MNKLKTFQVDTELKLTLENFLKYHNLSLMDFYEKNGDRSFARLCILAGLKERINKLLSNKVMMKEVCDILNYNYGSISLIDKNVDLGFTCLLDLHCDYSRDVIMAVLGYFNEDKKLAFREGVKYFDDKKLYIFFITLNKSDKDFSTSTLYEDYAINEKLFHWQSQSTTSVESKAGQRYINHISRGSKIALFVRESKTRDGITSPFAYLGTCEYRKHE